MNTLCETVRRCVLAGLRRRHEQLGRTGPWLDDPLVFADGLLDSLALLTLIAEVETCTGLELDMLGFDPAEVRTANDLVAQLMQALPQQV